MIIDSSVQLKTSNLNLNIINNIQQQPYITSNVFSNVLLNYITSNTLSNNLSLKQNILSASTTLYGNGNAITNISYTNLTNIPSTFNPDLTNIYSKTQTDTLLSAKESILTFNTPLTRATNTISIDLSSYYNKTNIDNINISQNIINSNYFINSNSLNNILNNQGFDTISLRNTALSSYTTTSGLTTLLSAKENILTFNTPLTRNTNTIGIDLSLYDTISARNTALGSYLTTATASSTYATITNLSLKENALTFSSPLTRTTNTIGIDLSLYDTISARNTALGSYLTTATASSTYATITNLNLKESILTFNAPLTRATNTISLDLSAYDTIALRNTAIASQNTINSNYFINSNSLNNILNNQGFLPLSGGTVSGALTVNGAINASGNSLIFGNTSGDFKIQLYSGWGFGIGSGELKYTAGGNHKFYNGTTNVFSIDSVGNCDMAGGLAITGSDAFFGTTNVDAANITNTFINLKYGGTTNDWCYIRQIGGFNAYELSFDFLDDADARFCIRAITSTNNPDTVTEVFSVNNGDTVCNGTFANHASSYATLGSLRIGGFDTTNTIYNATRNLGITVDTGYSITFNILSGNGVIMQIVNAGIYMYQLLTATSIRTQQLAIKPQTVAFSSSCYGSLFAGWGILLNNFWSGNYDNSGVASVTFCCCFVQNTNIKYYGRLLINAGGGVNTIIEDYKNPTSGVTMISVSNVPGSSGEDVLVVSQGSMTTSYTLSFKIYG
jgi:hypothetical protein